jgi:ribulose-phosphate 3-epimerase
MKSRAEVLRLLNLNRPVIAPSMLKCDFSDLDQEIKFLEQAGAVVLHWDVMDGGFVPNLSYGAMVLKSCRDKTDLIYDAHLMINQPEKYMDDYLNAGCEAITFHYEATSNPIPLLEKIRQADRVAGIAINPGTPVSNILHLLPFCDLILVMSVEPGFGGQKFMPEALPKLQELRSFVSPECILSIDGGVAEETIGLCAQAGAGLFVCGSSVFDRPNYQQAIQHLAQLATSMT